MYMGNVQIKCAKRNCYWTGPIEEYEAHLKECVVVKLERVTKQLEKSEIEIKDSANIRSLQKRRIEMLRRAIAEKVEAIQSRDETIESMKKRQKCDN